MTNLKAVIYCRVSTKEQLEGYSLKYQEAECMRFAERYEIEVLKCFIDRGESAKTAERTELKNLLKFIALHKKEISYIIIHKIDRLSRNVNDTSSLCVLFSKLGIELKSVTENIDNSPVGKFIINVLSSCAQFDNDIRAERTTKGMIEAIKEGRWVHRAPFGYKNIKINGKKTISPNENAKYVSKAYECYSKGILTQTEIVRLLKLEGFESCTKQHLNKILNNYLYAGIIKDVLLDEPVEGSFQSIIGKETFYLVQGILKGKRPSFEKRLINNPDFPLRHFLICPYCGKFITGSWSKGKTKRYAYYHCVTKNCQFGNIRKEVIESEFIKALEKLEPKEKVLDLFSEILNEVWEEKQKDQYVLIKKIEKDISDLKNRKNKIADLAIEDVFNDKTFKEQNEIVENEIVLKTIQLNELSIDYDDISKCINSCEYFLKNISKLWITSELQLRQKFQKIIFPEGIIFKDRIIGTPKISTVFRVLNPEIEEKSTMVPIEYSNLFKDF